MNYLGFANSLMLAIADTLQLALQAPRGCYQREPAAAEEVSLEAPYPGLVAVTPCSGLCPFQSDLRAK